MRNIRTILFTAVSLFGSSLFGYGPIGDFENQYGYLNLGLGPLPFPIPTFGGGYRIQREHQAFDINGSLLIVASERWGIKASGRYLYYFSPDWERQFYMGAGPSISSIFHYNDSRFSGVAFSPELLIGREHVTAHGGRRFLELVIDFPTLVSNGDAYKYNEDDHLIYYPYVYAQYGWGF